MLRRSQVCSALRRLCLLGLAFGHGCAALGHAGLRPGAASPPIWTKKSAASPNGKTALLIY